MPFFLPPLSTFIHYVGNNFPEFHKTNARKKTSVHLVASSESPQCSAAVRWLCISCCSQWEPMERMASSICPHFKPRCLEGQENRASQSYLTVKIFTHWFLWSKYFQFNSLLGSANLPHAVQWVLVVMAVNLPRVSEWLCHYSPAEKSQWLPLWQLFSVRPPPWHFLGSSSGSCSCRASQTLAVEVEHLIFILRYFSLCREYLI